jgi:hypothetical protein
MSRQRDVGSRDACRILQDSLLMFILYVMNHYSHTIIAARSTRVSSSFSYTLP